MWEYKGNLFELKNDKYRYRKTNKYEINRMVADEEELWLPEQYLGDAVVAWELEEEWVRAWHEKWDGKPRTYPNVRFLHIPKTMESIKISNTIFPNLERIEIDSDNKTFSTNGTMIFTTSREDYGYSRKSEKWLKYCLVGKGEEMTIPEDIDGIYSDAFAGTQYTTIRFPQKNMEIAQDAFADSRWLETREYPIIINDLIYKIDKEAERLVIPNGVKRIHPKAFTWGHHVKEINSPFQPGGAALTAISEMNSCRSLIFTSKQARINIRNMRRIESLEGVFLPEKHKQYKTVDGVIFSADGRKLIYYPTSKRDRRYEIPDGVQKIEQLAFAYQKYVEEIIMPDSVKVIGAKAFYKCGRLRQIHLSPQIKEIPDSNIYEKGGVFEGCKYLKRIEMPEGLIYLGSYAFYGSGLEDIVLNKRLQQIGEFGLAAKNLTEISLPESVKRVGKGSMIYAKHIQAYEGSARGLVSAVNAIFPGMKEGIANLTWERCEVTVRHHRSEKQEIFLIPGSLAKTAACHLDMAWNNDKIDYEEYDECLSKINDSTEKIEFARNGIARHPSSEENPFVEYIRHVSYKIGASLLEAGKEEEFLIFLKEGYLSENSLAKLIKVSNQCGMTVCTAYIMEAQNKSNKKRPGFRL
ncbi:MAG: leucine-rich repeat domain-containing protein [Clostridiales bacterium]|nr:leucine-rich repeat domain-containing protein [Clostridiales bacterium]